jgi:hypothetical protein
MNGTSRAVLVTCGDGKDYVVKGSHLGRAVISEQIVAYLANALDAPVPPASLVAVDAELISMNAGLLGHLPAGLAHGSMSVVEEIVEDKDCTVKHCDLPENRSRYARLAVLFGLVQHNDLQFFFRKNPPFLVYSFDHAYFFPNGPNWTLDSLAQAGPAALCPEITSGCRFTDQEMASALEFLTAVDQQKIAEAVAAPPEEWAFPMDYRIAAAKFLFRRRAELLTFKLPQT